MPDFDGLLNNPKYITTINGETLPSLLLSFYLTKDSGLEAKLLEVIVRLYN